MLHPRFKPKSQTKQPRPKTGTSEGMKRSQIEFMQIQGGRASSSSNSHRNPRNCFFAQRWKKNHSNGNSYRPPTQIQAFFKKKQQGMDVPLYFLDIKQSARHISRSLALYTDHLQRQSQSPNGRPESRQCSTINLRRKAPQVFFSNQKDEAEQYFSTVKFHKRPEKKKSRFEFQRNSYGHSMEIEEGEIFTGQNLNIRGLVANPVRVAVAAGRKETLCSQPSDSKYQNRQERVLTQQAKMQNNENAQITKYQSVFQQKPKHKKLRKTSVIPSDLNVKKQSRPSLSPRSPQRKANLTSYLGQIKPNIAPQMLQRLKGLYYRDLIWKTWFNCGWKVQLPNYEPPRYFVGRGNNSKLVKAVMGRRWWWKQQSQDKNAHFLWTQLKIYSAYQVLGEYPKVVDFQDVDQVHENLNQPNQNQKSQQVFFQEKGQASEEQTNWWNMKSSKDKNTYLLTTKKYAKWTQYLKSQINLKRQLKSTQALEGRKILEKKIQMQIKQKYPEKATNHLQYSRLIGNKKALFKTMSLYYELSKKKNKFLPQTFHIISGLEDQEYLKFLNEYYRKCKQQNNSMWIVKPGQMSNRGCGIVVCPDIQSIKKILKNKKTHSNGKPFSYIIQQYLREPFLYQGRKFDIRHYIMIVSEYGRIRGYWYQQGYIRTTSYKYSTNNSDAYVHLTNDAVQKYCKDYGKYEKGNKVSYQQFQKYLSSTGLSFYSSILPKIRQISADVMRASYPVIDINRKGNNFQIFGLDIMIDSNFRPWLIEVNTNPCLQLSSPVLAKVIPKMLDNAFAIALDPLFPPPLDPPISSKKNSLPDNYVHENKFQLVFDEAVDGRILNKIYQESQARNIQGIGSDQQAYESAEDQCDAAY